MINTTKPIHTYTFLWMNLIDLQCANLREFVRNKAIKMNHSKREKSYSFMISGNAALAVNTKK